MGRGRRDGSGHAGLNPVAGMQVSPMQRVSRSIWRPAAVGGAVQWIVSCAPGCRPRCKARLGLDLGLRQASLAGLEEGSGSGVGFTHLWAFDLTGSVWVVSLGHPGGALSLQVTQDAREWAAWISSTVL